MTREQAVREARKRWGAKAYIRVGDRVSSPERREQARADNLAAKAELEAIDAEIKARLKDCEWYQALLARKHAALAVKDRSQGLPYYHKFSVGESNGIFAHVRGTGDTWAEAFAAADTRKP